MEPMAGDIAGLPGICWRYATNNRVIAAAGCPLSKFGAPMSHMLHRVSHCSVILKRSRLEFESPRGGHNGSSVAIKTYRNLCCRGGSAHWILGSGAGTGRRAGARRSRRNRDTCRVVSPGRSRRRVRAGSGRNRGARSHQFLRLFAVPAERDRRWQRPGSEHHLYSRRRIDHAEPDRGRRGRAFAQRGLLPRRAAAGAAGPQSRRVRGGSGAHRSAVGSPGHVVRGQFPGRQCPADHQQAGPGRVLRQREARREYDQRRRWGIEP